MLQVGIKYIIENVILSIIIKRGISPIIKRFNHIGFVMPVIKKDNTNLLEKLEYIEAALNEHELDEKIIEEICSYVRDGVPRKVVAKAIGVSYTKLLEWIKIGQGRISIKEKNLTLYKLLVKKIDQAEALAEIDHIRLMKKAAEGGAVLLEKETSTKFGVNKEIRKSGPNWGASAWLLERRDTEHFSKRPMEEDLETQEENVDNQILQLLGGKGLPTENSEDVIWN